MCHRTTGPAAAPPAPAALGVFIINTGAEIITHTRLQGDSFASSIYSLLRHGRAHMSPQVVATGRASAPMPSNVCTEREVRVEGVVYQFGDDGGGVRGRAEGQKRQQPEKDAAVAGAEAAGPGVTSIHLLWGDLYILWGDPLKTSPTALVRIWVSSRLTGV